MSVSQGLYARDSFRYGMLALLLALWGVEWWMWFSDTPRDRSGTTLNLVVCAMLLVNHIISAFLTVEQQRRIRLAQMVFVGGGVFYVFVAVFRRF